MNKNPTKEPTFLSSGTYGCIFRPGIPCEGNTQTQKGMLTKIQTHTETTAQEKRIGEKIQKITNGHQYYAPIVSSCNVSLSKVTDSEIEKCKILPKNKEGLTTNAVKYEANQIRYVGKDTLLQYLLGVFKSKPENLVRTIVHSHNKLLDGFRKLALEGIIHFDVKENNIMCKDKSGTPIIIDFGLSVDVETISENNYKDIFYVYGPDYAPWCIEIATIAYAANKIPDTEETSDGFRSLIGIGEDKGTVKWNDQLVKPEQITTIITDYFTKNSAIKKHLNDVQRNDYRNKIQQYYNTFIGKKWEVFVNELLKSKLTWDNYALAVMYLSILNLLRMDENVTDKLSEYKKYLEEIITRIPSERINCDDTKMKLKNDFKNISRSENNRMNKNAKRNANNKEMNNEVTKEVNTSIKVELIEQTNIYSPRQ